MAKDTHLYEMSCTLDVGKNNVKIKLWVELVHLKLGTL